MTPTKTIADYTAATTIDGTTHYLLIQPGGAGTAYKKINRNTYLGVTGQPVDISTTQTISNKILGNSNLVTLLDGGFTLQNNVDTTKRALFSLASITTGQTRTYTLPDATSTLANLTSTQTFTNKTLTAPTITGGSIDQSTITVDSIAGHTSSTTGTIYGLSISSGKVGTNGVITASITDSAVTPAKLVAGTGATWVTATLTPTKTGWASTTKNVWQYVQMGKMVWLYFDISGTSNSTSTNVTLPIAARSFSATNLFEGTYGLGVDNGAPITQPRWDIDLSGSSTTCNFFTTYAGGGWTASGTKQIRGYIIYEAA